MSEEEAMDDDPLIESWDAYVAGRGLHGLDRLDSQDREVIEMLHSRTWSPSPRPSFASDLRARLTAEGRSRPIGMQTATNALPPPPIARRPASSHRWRSAVLAAALVAGLLISFGGRLVDAPPPPTVQAPVAQAVSTVPASASPSAGWAACGPLPTFGPEAGSTFIDTDVAPELAAPLAGARHVTIQELTAENADVNLATGPGTPGDSAIVIDAVVSGAARAHTSGVGMLQTITGPEGSTGYPVGPVQTLDLVHGDLLIYPLGAVDRLLNPLDGRGLRIIRVILHETTDPTVGADDTAAIRTIGEGRFPGDIVEGWEPGFVISLPYVGGIPPDQPALTPCRYADGYLLAAALAPVEYDDGPRLSGILVVVSPVDPPGP